MITKVAKHTNPIKVIVAFVIVVSFVVCLEHAFPPRVT